MINNLQEPEVVRYLNSEIKRFDILNYLIEKYKLVNYLEIGVFQGENIRLVKAAHKDGVDPGHEGYVVPEVNYPITSDAFFELIKEHNDIKYDIIFIDGLHHADQVEKDIQNSLNHLVDNGFIVIHDCNPSSYETQLVPRQTIAWTGDVWKAFVDFKINNKDFPCYVIDTDFGVGVIQNINSIKPIFNNNNVQWDQLNKNKKEILNLVSWEEFKNKI
jgi:hypothetical protein